MGCSSSKGTAAHSQDAASPARTSDAISKKFSVASIAGNSVFESEKGSVSGDSGVLFTQKHHSHRIALPHAPLPTIASCSEAPPPCITIQESTAILRDSLHPITELENLIAVDEDADRRREASMVSNKTMAMPPQASRTASSLQTDDCSSLGCVSTATQLQDSGPASESSFVIELKEADRKSAHAPRKDSNHPDSIEAAKPSSVVAPDNEFYRHLIEGRISAPDLLERAQAASSSSSPAAIAEPKIFADTAESEQASSSGLSSQRSQDVDTQEVQGTALSLATPLRSTMSLSAQRRQALRESVKDKQKNAASTASATSSPRICRRASVTQGYEAASEQGQLVVRELEAARLLQEEEERLKSLLVPGLLVPAIPDSASRLSP